MQKITPCLWFETEAEEAAHFYAGVFRNSKILAITHYGDSGPLPKGTVLTIKFELDGQEFMALNGGPHQEFNDSISLIVNCKDQKDLDMTWDKLTAGGGSEVQCGWIKDKYGVSWQIVPVEVQSMLTSGDPAKTNRMMSALLQMKKLDIKTLKAAYDG